MQKENLTFNDLPEVISQLKSDIGFIKQFLIENKSSRYQESDQWLNISELCNFLPDKPSKNTIYSWVQNRTIPFHKGAKKLRFLKSEIDNWMKNDKIISFGPEIQPERNLKIKVEKRG